MQWLGRENLRGKPIITLFEQLNNRIFYLMFIISVKHDTIKLNKYSLGDEYCAKH